MTRLFESLFLFLALLALCVQAELIEKFLSRSGHTNNWAVLVSTSRFWFNYRVPFRSLPSD
jgi:GPI-anchor transamidase subunit K